MSFETRGRENECSTPSSSSRASNTTPANVHDLTPAAELLHGGEEVIYADAGYQGIDKRSEMAGEPTTFRVAMRPGKRRALPVTPDGKLLDLIETAKAHIRAKAERTRSEGETPTASIHP